ncbi:hypothetical protein GOP47_0025637, partial [Adiantum capillus-veneris]
MPVFKTEGNMCWSSHPMASARGEFLGTMLPLMVHLTCITHATWLHGLYAVPLWKAAVSI